MQYNHFDFEALQSAIIRAAGITLQEFKDKHPAEEICAFALYSDEGAMTICNAINTTTHLNTCRQDNPDEVLYYKFEPVEWQYESIFGNSAFNELSKNIAAEVRKEDIVFSTFKRKVFDACGRALVHLKKEFDPEVLLIFSVSDSDITAPQRQLIHKLNSPANCEEFALYLETSA